MFVFVAVVASPEFASVAVLVRHHLREANVVAFFSIAFVVVVAAFVAVVIVVAAVARLHCVYNYQHLTLRHCEYLHYQVERYDMNLLMGERMYCLLYLEELLVVKPLTVAVADSQPELAVALLQQHLNLYG